MPAVRKPTISARSAPLLAALDREIRRWDCRGADLPHVASDPFDDLVLREELDDLIRRRLLRLVRFDDRGKECRDVRTVLCGTSWTVHLTPRAVRAFWPERATA